MALLTGRDFLTICYKYHSFDACRYLTFGRITILDTLRKIVEHVGEEVIYPDDMLGKVFRQTYEDLYEDKDNCRKDMLKILNCAHEEPEPASLLLWFLMQPALIRKSKYNVGCGLFNLNDGFVFHDVCMKVARDKELLQFCRNVLNRCETYCSDVVCFSIRMLMSALRLGQENVVFDYILCSGANRRKLDDEMIHLYCDLSRCVSKIASKHVNGVVDAFQLIRNVCNYGGNSKRLNVNLYKKLKVLPAYTNLRETLDSLREVFGDSTYNVFRSWLRGNYSYVSEVKGTRLSNKTKAEKDCRRCDSWGCNRIAVIPCTTCEANAYCSISCRNADWKMGHKKHCKRRRTENHATSGIKVSKEMENIERWSDDTVCTEFDVNSKKKGSYSSLLGMILFFGIILAWLLHVALILD